MTPRQRWAAPLLAALCGVILSTEVLVRPAIGIANNNDFAKMAGAFGLGPEDGDWSSHQQYGEFVYKYIRADRYIYNRGWRDAGFLSSEFFLVKLARGIQRLVRPGPRFDIRWLGGVNGAFFLLAIVFWIYGLPEGWRFYGGLLTILIWTDTGYVQYMNSFYMDTAAMIFLVLSAAVGLHVAKDCNHRGFALFMVSGAVLFAGSKSQHAPPAFLFVALFIAFAFWSSDRFARATWATGAVLVILVALLVLGRDTPQRRSVPVFTMVFWRLAPAASDPVKALEELGLGKAEAPLLHTHAYFPNSPVQNDEWARRFRLRCNYITLVMYYLRHPSIPIHFLYQDLSEQAAIMRPYANRSLDDGFPAGAQAGSFSYWTDLRSYLLRRAPWHIILLMAVTGSIWLWLLLRSPGDRPLASVALMIQMLAAMEYGIAVLGDAAETNRHLLLFNVATEISLLMLPSLIWKIWQCLQVRERIQVTTDSVAP